MPALEWVQCHDCGRRHRWRVELANTRVVCGCGAQVAMPDLKAFEAAQGRDPDATSAGSGATLIDINEPDVVQAGRLSQYQGKGAGLWGMSTLSTFLFWFAVSLAGFFFLVHAIILRGHAIWSIAGAIIFVPVPFFKVRQWYKRWLRGRTLSQAIDEELNRGSAA